LSVLNANYLRDKIKGDETGGSMGDRKDFGGEIWRKQTT
jgi:hypothetical protein